MKKALRSLFALVLLVAGLSGCSDSGVSTVKNGVLDFDKSITIGQAFDNYKYLKGVAWRSFTSDNGRDVVEVTGDIAFDLPLPDGEKTPKAVFQFVINQDDTLQLKYAGVEVDGEDLLGGMGFIGDLAKMEILGSVYQNQFMIEAYSQRAHKAVLERNIKNAFTAAMAYLTEYLDGTVDSLDKLVKAGFKPSKNIIWGGGYMTAYENGIFLKYNVPGVEVNRADAWYNGSISYHLEK